LPAAIVLLAEIACAISADIAPFPRAKSVVFARCAPLLRIRSPNGTSPAKTTLFASRQKKRLAQTLLKTPQAFSAK
jgi:hypothetical protein